MRYCTDIDNKTQHLPAEIIQLLNSRCERVVCIGIREYRYLWDGPETADQINKELEDNNVKFKSNQIK